jgi:serine/threonine-protein kinase
VFEKIFELQSDISKQIALAMDVTLLEPERKLLEAKPTENLEAYDFYLKGNEYSERSNSEKDLQIAVEMYEKAVNLDPDFALAHAELSQAHARIYWFFHDRTEARLVKSKLAVERALLLKPDLPEAHSALGFYYYWGRGDYERALKEFAIAQKSQPNHSDLLAAIGYVQRRQGKWEEALANIKKSFELNPRSHMDAWEVAMTYFLLRRYPEAEHYWNLSLSLAPDFSGAYISKASLYLNWRGDIEKAGEALKEGVERVGLAEFMAHPPGALRVLFRVPGGFYLNELDQLPAEAFGSDTFGFFLFKAELSGLLRRPELETAFYDSARIILENKVKAEPLDFWFRGHLSTAYAGLGRKEEAIREGKKAMELNPETKDGFGALLNLENLARIYVMTGEKDAAIDQLEYLLSIPSFTSISRLRVDPFIPAFSGNSPSDIK